MLVFELVSFLSTSEIWLHKKFPSKEEGKFKIKQVLQGNNFKRIVFNPFSLLLHFIWKPVNWLIVIIEWFVFIKTAIFYWNGSMSFHERFTEILKAVFETTRDTLKTWWNLAYDKGEGEILCNRFLINKCYV